MIFIILLFLFGGTAIYGFASSQIILALTALVAFVLTLAYKRDFKDLSYYENIIDDLDEVDKEAHRSPDFATLELSQKVVYLNAFRKGAKTIIKKFKNNRLK